VAYRSEPNFQGTDVLTATAYDLGNTGEGPPGTGTTTVDITVIDTNPWQNTLRPGDVTNDGSVRFSDLVEILEYLSIAGPGPVPTGNNFSPPPYVDANGNNMVTMTDIVYVLELLNMQYAREAEASDRVTTTGAEGESAASDVVAPGGAIDSRSAINTAREENAGGTTDPGGDLLSVESDVDQNRPRQAAAAPTSEDDERRAFWESADDESAADQEVEEVLDAIAWEVGEAFESDDALADDSE
jgi:hypothetical protein